MQGPKKTGRVKRTLKATIIAAGAGYAFALIPLFRGTMEPTEYAELGTKIEEVIERDPNTRKEYYGYAMQIVTDKRNPEMLSGLVFWNRKAIERNPQEFTSRLNTAFKKAGLKITAGNPKPIDIDFIGGKMRIKINSSLVQLKGRTRVNLWEFLDQKHKKPLDLEIKLRRRMNLRNIVANTNPKIIQPVQHAMLRKVQHRA